MADQGRSGYKYPATNLVYKGFDVGPPVKHPPVVRRAMRLEVHELHSIIRVDLVPFAGDEHFFLITREVDNGMVAGCSAGNC